MSSIFAANILGMAQTHNLFFLCINLNVISGKLLSSFFVKMQ